MNNETITFYQHILPMFNQYDRVMMLLRFDMYDYETVKQWAKRIHLSLQPSDDPNQAKVGWSKLEGTHVMPKIPGPWPKDWQDQFGQWIEGGCQMGIPPYTPPTTPTGDTFTLFVSLSQKLTGFDQCGVSPDSQMLARMYYHRLINESQYGDQMESMLNTWSANQNATEEVINTEVFEKFGLCKDLIVVWYNATITPKGGSVGLYDEHAAPFQYQMALAWQASWAHPQGWAPENTPFYWRFPSSQNGYNGLGHFSH